MLSSGGVQSGDKLPNMRHFQVKMTLVHKPVAGSFRASFPHADPSDVNTCFPVALKLLSHFGELVEMWDRFEGATTVIALNTHGLRKEWDRKLAAAKEIFLNCNTPHVVDSAVPLSEVRGALERFKTVRGLRVFLMDRSGNLLPESPLYTDATGPVLNMLFDERDGHVIPIVGSLNSQPWVRVLPDSSEERFFHEFQCRRGWMILSFIQKLLNDPATAFAFWRMANSFNVTGSPCLIPSAVTVLGLLFFAGEIKLLDVRIMSAAGYNASRSAAPWKTATTPAKFGGWCQVS
ncbi:unnamed protein product, partial [Mesorhabditis spiculigera]